MRKPAKQAQHIWCDITDDDGRIRGSAERQIEKAIKRIWKNGFKAGQKQCVCKQPGRDSLG